MFLRADSVLWSGFCGAVVLEEKRRRGTGGVINCFLLLKTDEQRGNYEGWWNFYSIHLGVLTHYVILEKTLFHLIFFPFPHF